MVSRLDRCALFVDAGYALADGAMAVHGTRRRDSVRWDHAGLLKLLAGLARDRTGLPVLRCYWYETAEDRTTELDALAEMPGLKLRHVNTRPGRREGIESQLRRDIVTLAKNGAITDAFIASADERLAEMVAEVQDLGLRIVVLHIASNGSWSIPQALRQECDDIVEISSVHLRPFVDLIRGAEPGAADEQYANSGYGSRSGANGDVSRAGSNAHNAVPVAALPAAVADYPVQAGSHYGSTRPESSVGAADPGTTPSYLEAKSPDEAGVRSAGGAQERDERLYTAPGGAALAGGSQSAGAQAANARAGMEASGTGPAGAGQAGIHHGVRAGHVGTDRGGVEQFGPGAFGNGRIDPESRGAGPARMGEFGAAQAGTGQFGTGAAQFGGQAGPEEFGAGQGRAGQSGAHAAQEQFGAGDGSAERAATQAAAEPYATHASGDQLGVQAGLGPFVAGQAGSAPAGNGRSGAEQFGTGPAGHLPYGSGQFGYGHNGPVRQPDSLAQPASPGQPSSGERGSQQHSGGAEPSRGSGQLAAAAHSGQQPGDTGQHAQPPQHAATSTAHQGSLGLGAPRHEYGVSQEPRAAQAAGGPSGAGVPGAVQEPPTPRQAPHAAPQHAAHGLAQHASLAMPQNAGHGGAPQHAPSGAHPGGTGYGGISPGIGHGSAARDGAGYGATEPAGGFQGGLGLSGAAQSASHGDAAIQDRMARGIHAQTGPYQHGHAIGGVPGGYHSDGSSVGYQNTAAAQAGSGHNPPDVRTPHLSGLTSYQGSYGGHHIGPGQNGSAHNAAPAARDDPGRGGYASFAPYQPGSTPNGGATNGGPRGAEPPRPPSAGFAAAPTSVQPQPYGATDRGFVAGQPGGLVQGAAGPGHDPFARNGYQAAQPEGSGPYSQYQEAPVLPAVRPAQSVAVSLSDAIKAAHSEGYDFGESVGRGAPGLWLEAVLARKPRMPSDLEARLLQGSRLPIDSLLHDDVRHSLRRGFWEALETVRR
jgi:NYN domain